MFYKVHEHEQLEKQKAAAETENQEPYIPEPYDPNQDGFVCTNAEIKAHIGRRRCWKTFYGLNETFRMAA
jgi:hypothetical protein